MQATMEIVLACLNHFPLFAMMLRLKDPDRLPGGIRLEVCPERFFFDRATPLRWVVSSFRSVSTENLRSQYQRQQQQQQQNQQEDRIDQQQQQQHPQQQQQFQQHGMRNRSLQQRMDLGATGSGQLRQRHANGQYGIQQQHPYFGQPPSSHLFSYQRQPLQLQQPYMDTHGPTDLSAAAGDMFMDQEKVVPSVSYLFMTVSDPPLSVRCQLKEE